MDVRIVCAANRVVFDDGYEAVLIGARHWDRRMSEQANEYIKAHGKCKHNDRRSDQGFIDQFGNYHTREEAWIIAEKNGQIIRNVSKAGVLYSENLY